LNKELKDAIRKVYDLASKQGYSIKFSMKVVDVEKVHDWEEVRD